MLKLINIKKTDRYIEADYIPENLDVTGYVRFDFCDNSEVLKAAPGDEYTSYPRMAMKGLKSILKDISEHPDGKLPEERLIMWY